MFYRMFDRIQILPNTLNHSKTYLNSPKQGAQTENVLACFTVKHLPFGQAFKNLLLRATCVVVPLKLVVSSICF